MLNLSVSMSPVLDYKDTPPSVACFKMWVFPRDCKTNILPVNYPCIMNSTGSLCGQ